LTSTQAAILRQLGRRPMLPALLLRRRPERPRAGVVAFGLALFVAVFAVRLVVPSASDPVLIFSAVPIALLALEAGTKGGVAGATVAVAGVGLWSLIENVEFSVLGYLTRVSTFFLVGVLVGQLADHLGRARDAQKLLLDLTPESAFALDLDGQVTVANSAAEDLFGYRADGLVGLPVDQLVPDFFGALERSLRDPTSPGDALQLTACSKDGRAARVRATVEGLASDTGVLLVRLRRAHVWPEIVGPWRGRRI
jgi:PAS domain S-box-containing protein